MGAGRSRRCAAGELRATGETVYPADLGDLVTETVTTGVPERPVVLR
ncbi:hypothetical protein [Herbidospora galbida]|nr:hypothetical protein [Herbidospora galbida]